MQIKRQSDIEQFLKSPKTGIEGALIYGKDLGLVRERSKKLEAAILGKTPDPFGLVELSETDIKDAPGALYAEAAAISMLGGRKFIRIRTNLEPAVKAYLAEREAGAPVGDSFFVIEAGDLNTRTSPLFKAADASPLIATIACYADNAENLETVLDEMLRKAGAAIAPDAKAELLERLGGDRGLSRQEIDKLLLYCGAFGGKKVQITRADVVELVGDTSAADLDKLLDAVFTGDVPEAARLNARLAAAGQNAVRILRAAATHLDRLAGSGPSWGRNSRQDEAIQRQQSRWPARNLARAQSLVLEAETQCKTTGLPADEICERTLLALAKGARDAQPR